MALLQSELLRCRSELGYNVLSAGAEPYIGVTAIFDQVIATYLNAGATTTSATAVVAATTPTLVTLTLTDATDFDAGTAIVLDVDARQERATIESVTGSTVSLLLTGKHTGTYPVTVEGGETMVRETLNRILGVKAQIETMASTAGLKRAEDIEWYQSKRGGSSALDDLKALLMHWRDELASILGVCNMWRMRQTSGQTLSIY